MQNRKIGYWESIAVDHRRLSSLELEDRYESRQIDPAKRCVVEKKYKVDDLMDDDSGLSPVISTQKR